MNKCNSVRCVFPKNLWNAVFKHIELSMHKQIDGESQVGARIRCLGQRRTVILDNIGMRRIREASVAGVYSAFG